MATTITGNTIDVNTAVLNRLSTDGTIVDLQKDGTSVGSIDSRAGVVSTIILNPASGNGAGLSGGTKTIVPADEAGIIDNDISLGISSHRFKDLYLSGGVYLGGTGAANFLQDYETGTFTATLTATTAPTSPPTATGEYVKIGDLCHFAIHRFGNADTSGASGAMVITGLPFLCGKSTTTPAPFTNGFNFTTAANQNFDLNVNTTILNAYESVSGAGWNQWTITAGTGKYMVISGSYITA